LIFWRGADPVAAFAAYFREKKKAPATAIRALPLDERLARYIVEGSRDGLIADLNEKLKEAAPLDIVNGPLMRGMDEVGRLFGDNQLIVAEVLQSAEAMKAAVAHLEPFMEKAGAATRGTIVLATVKGDVHDIGKNLVEIILSNNGYRVINLGIKVPPEELIAAYHTHKPDAFGLSGLLVKSAQQMVVTAQDLRAASIDLPLFVGGAALTRKFTATRIAPEYGGLTLYARDAMEGLDLANQLFSAVTRDGLVERVLASRDPKALELHETVERLKHDAVTERLLRAHGVYRWFRARAAGDALIVFAPAGRELARFEFPRQTDGERLCLADYVRDAVDDCIALLAVTSGEGVRELAARWKDRGEYVRSHALGALAIECAEAFAEMLHARLRTLWGFPDPPDLAISEKLKGRYRGIRVSSGYPACRHLADQHT